MKRVTILLTAFLLTSPAFAQSITVGSKWKNPGGSEMTISTIATDGSITGTYINRVTGFSCKNETMKLSGWIEGNLINFAVRWKNKNVDCKSITSWTGYLAAGKIFTDWDLIYTATATGLPTHLKDNNVFSPK